MAYLNTRADIPAVIAEMTLDEKVKFVTTPTEIHTMAIDRLGIPSIQIQDGGTGVNYVHLFSDLECEGKVHEIEGFALMRDLHYYLDHPDEGTPEIKQLIKTYWDCICERYVPNGKRPGSFPPGMPLGATWDPETVWLCANALGRELDAYKVDVILGSPNVNILRVPRNGRLFEGYSEDPCLSATLAPEFVKGVQEAGPCANAKHFAVNNQETGRSGIDTHVSLRALYEIYFPGFKACVDAGCMTVMSAYNKLNGFACALNKWLLTDVLKNEWGFEGCVNSDWGAVYDQVDALNAGNDLEQPKVKNHDAVYEALKDGRLSEETLDKAVERVLRLVLASPAKKGRKYTDIDRDYSRAAAYKAMAEGTVMLKNNGLLPLTVDNSVCFYGELSKKLIDCGSGSAEVCSDQVTQLYTEAEKIAGPAKVTFEHITPSTDAVIVTVGARGQEGRDRPDMHMEHEDEDLLRRAIRDAKAAVKPVILILNIAAPVDLREFIDDVDAVLCIWLPGMEGAHVAADIIYGRLNPSGKLPLTFPKREEDAPCYLNFPGEAREVYYGEGIYVGYRYYDKKNIEPLFPFGFGLSYTSFKLSDIKLCCEQWNTISGKPLHVTCKLTNTGKMDGKEVVQLYINDEVSSLQKPVKELKAFKKVFVKAGETVEVAFDLEPQQFASWDPQLKGWVSEPGWFNILLGTSSRNIELSARVKFIGKNPYAVMPSAPAGTLVTNSAAVAVLKKYVPADLVDSFVSRVSIMPALSLEMFWKRSFSRAISGSSEEKNAIRDKIYAELSEIEIVQ